MRLISMAARLRAALCLALLAFLAVLLLQMWASYRSLLQVKMLASVEQVHAALKIAESYRNKAASGAISEAEAQTAAARDIGKIRYSGSEYIWINDLAPRMVMHPIKPELNGKDLSGIADPNGLHVFVAFADKVRQRGEGEVSYLWPRPGRDAPEPKRSFVMGYQPWGWVLGSGVYVDDVVVIARRDGTMALMTWALVVVVALLALELFLRGLRRRLGRAAVVMQAVAAGDLSAEVEIERADEVGEVLLQVQRMQRQLEQLVLGIRRVTDSIATASGEVASGSQDLSLRTEQAASNIEETSAAMQDLTQQVQQSALAARQTHELARSAASQAQSGTAVMQQMVQTMEGISVSSRKISDIIAVIDGVAFQTNILALNAAVEAARAGEQGRGFAVVASEVRALAKRSADAAKQIKGLILDSVERVGQGSALVERVGASMQDLLQAIEHVTTTVSEISASSAGQSDDIAHVNQAVNQLDGMTQQNAALVEQSAAAAESLKDQAAQLSALVAVFRTQQG